MTIEQLTREVTELKAIVNPICKNPPTNVVQAFNELTVAWTTIQATTHIPGTP